MILSKQQTKALDYLEDDTTNELLFGGATRGGKSMLGCYWQLKKRLKYPGTIGAICRSTLKTLRETTLLTFMKVAKLQGVESTFHYRAPTDIIFKNGSHIFLKELFYYPSDPDFDELGSLELTDLFIDEANQCVRKAVQVAFSRVNTGLMENDLIPKAYYSCNPARNWTKQEFRDKAVNGTLSHDKQFVQAFIDDNPFVSPLVKQSLMKMDKKIRERLVFGNWDYNDDPSQLVTSENIGNIFKNSFVATGQKRFITADIARFGKDRIIIRVWAGWRVLERIEKSKLAITQTADIIKLTANKYQIPMTQVWCDEDGIGGGVVDILKCKGFIANARPNESYKNKNNKNFATAKDQSGWYLADRLNSAEVYEACLDAELVSSITEELEQLKDAGLNKDEKNKLVNKEKISEAIGRSPDDLDTYLIRAWVDLASLAGSKLMLHSNV